MVWTFRRGPKCVSIPVWISWLWPKKKNLIDSEVSKLYSKISHLLQAHDMIISHICSSRSINNNNNNNNNISLLEDIKTQQLKCYGHVQRLEEGRLPKEVMKWSPPGRRKRGRPKATWTEGIRGLMGEKGLIEEDWKDRDKWKKKIIVKWAQEDVETSNNLLNK